MRKIHLSNYLIRMTNFQHYEAKDFAMEESFQKWVLKKDPGAVRHWESWIAAHPEKKDEVDKAEDMIRALSEEIDIAKPQDQTEVWQRVEDSLFTSKEKGTKNLYTRSWFYAAASVSLLIIATFGYWTIRQQEDKVYFATGFGETLNLVLPDSTLVTLNANSSLAYLPEWDESKKERVVWMEGEGFFDVSHRDGQKFIVHSAHASVEVLGTAFNVSERRGNTEVILNSGKVALQLQNERVLMKPGEKVSYHAETKQIEKKLVNAELLTSWRKNELVFEATPLSEIALLLEDNYDYKVKFESENIKSLLFSGTIRADKINLLLEALSETHRISIIQENDTLTLKKYPSL